MKVKVISILIALLAFAVNIEAKGASLQTQADSAYNAKDYAKAVALYNDLRQEKGSNAELLYNLGNAYYQDGDFGNAMVCYLRAHRLNPDNKELNQNLTFLRSKVDDANKAEQKGKKYSVTPDEEGFFQAIKRDVAINTSTNVWAVWGAVCFILFVGGVALYIFTRNVMARKVGFFGSMVSICLTVLFLCFAFMGARSYSARDEGVITAFKTILLTEPGKEGDMEKGKVLTRGTQVRIVSEETDAEGNVNWIKIRLNSDYIGWVEAENIVVI